jgi:hypothetical protein
MARFSRLIAGGTLLACLAASPLGAQGGSAGADAARARNLNAYAELLRSDIREQKVALITGMMQFSEADDQKFWPVYREYEGELSSINDQRLALIREYAQAYEKLTDEIANRLAHAALDLEARRNALKTKYYERLTTILPARTAARVLQVENQILLLLDLQIAASLPVIE